MAVNAKPYTNPNYRRQDLLGLGVPAEVAGALDDSVLSAVPALASTLATAQTSNADIVHIGSAASNNNAFTLRVGTGFKKRQTVINGTSNTVQIFPPTAAGWINNQAAGTSFSLLSGLAAEFVAVDTAGTQYWKKG